MKAFCYTKYGPPEVLELKNMPKPIPNSQEVLVKVHAATVNRTDWGFLKGEPFIGRFWSGLFRPKNPILGNEFAGVVEAIGNEVTEFKEGDRVFGYNDVTFGAHAEYLVQRSDGPIYTIPSHLSFEEAAPGTEGAHYALNYIRAANIQASHHVLIYGATGAIGSAALQLIKAMNVKVTAVCGTKNLELIKSLGADEVIDYTRQDFTQIDAKFDMVFDAVGKSSFAECKTLLKDKGIYCSTELGKGSQNPFLALITPVFGGKKVLFPIPTIHKSDIIFLKNLMESGKFKPLVDKIYPLEALQEAFHYVGLGQKVGNVVIRVEDAVKAVL